MKVRRPLLLCTVIAANALAGSAFAQSLPHDSAWDQLLKTNPAIVDDESVTWRDRVALDALTPDQGRAYLAGMHPEEITLPNGWSLETYLQATLKTPPTTFTALSGPCTLFEGNLNAREIVSVATAIEDCELPDDAVALMVTVSAQAEALTEEAPSIKIWSPVLPEPGEPLLRHSGSTSIMTAQTTTVIPVCVSTDCDPSALQLKSSERTIAKLSLIGYFTPSFYDESGLAATGTGNRMSPLAVESPFEAFFGIGAGAVNTGERNSFFGVNAGTLNSSGEHNSYFGHRSGSANTTGSYNAFYGQGTGCANTIGSRNSFFGNGAGEWNTTAGDNSFFGFISGLSNTTGDNNSFFGSSSGWSNTTGAWNTYLGSNAGRENTTGPYNTFIGGNAGRQNTTDQSNVFVGYTAGLNTVSGLGNTFIGHGSGGSNIDGDVNTFVGFWAGKSSISAKGNTFVGFNSGGGNETGTANAFFGNISGEVSNGDENAFFGQAAGEKNTTGSGNTFLGRASGRVNTTGIKNTYVGSRTGEGNTIVGFSGNAADGIVNATAIGTHAQVAQSNSLILGSIAGLNNAQASVNVGIGTPAPQRQLHLSGPNALFRMDRPADTAAFMIVRTDNSGAPLKSFVLGTNASGPNAGEFVINDLGAATGGPGVRRMTVTNAGEVHFTGTVRTPRLVQTSSARFKTDIETISNANATVRELRGVRFNWIENGEPSLGFIAEEVADVLPELVEFDKTSGQAEAVNYAAMVSVLVEALKEQEARIGTLEAGWNDSKRNSKLTIHQATLPIRATGGSALFQPIAQH